MYISPINNSQNINTKAKLEIISESYLLSKNAIQRLEQKAGAIGSDADKTIVNICNKVIFEEKPKQTVLVKGIKNIISIRNNKINNEDKLEIEGSHKERQTRAFGFISNYLDNLKK